MAREKKIGKQAKVRFVCSACSSTLKAEFEGRKWVVEPCCKCAKAQHEEGRQKGRRDAEDSMEAW